MNAWTIGARSVGRNRRRTIATVGAMAFAGAFCIFYGSLIEGMMASLERNALRMETGEIQIHHPGYRRDPDLYGLIENSDEIVTNLEAKGYAVSPRLYAYGLAAAGITSAGIQMRGVDVVREGHVTKVADHLAKGSWLDAADPHGVVLGRRLAKTLRVDVGAEVIVLSQAADGSMANDIFNVRGVLRPVNEGVDRTGIFVGQAAFRELFALGDGAHEIALSRHDNTVSIDDARSAVAALAEGEEVLTWRKLRPMLSDMLNSSLAAQIFMMLIIYAAIAMVILNATLMSVFERIREFGVMKALGVTPWQIVTIVFVEVFGQALLAAVIAVGVGVPAAYFFQSHGIDLSAFMKDVSMAGVAFDPVWYTELTASNSVTPMIVLVIVSLLSAIYPGVKAAVIRPVEALHHQ